MKLLMKLLSFSAVRRPLKLPSADPVVTIPRWLKFEPLDSATILETFRLVEIKPLFGKC